MTDEFTQHGATELQIVGQWDFEVFTDRGDLYRDLASPIVSRIGHVRGSLGAISGEVWFNQEKLLDAVS